MKLPWIIAKDGTQGEDSYKLQCLRCGGTQKFDPPILVDYYVKVAKAFAAAHKGCRAGRGSE